jgi:nucleoside-diphosphate-sugar epimerase
VLIPGGAGFNGSPTVDWLLDEGYLVKVINNISAEISETLPSRNLKSLSLLEDLGCLQVESFSRKKKDIRSHRWSIGPHAKKYIGHV